MSHTKEVTKRWDSIWSKTNDYTLYSRRVFKTTEKANNLVNFGLDFLHKKVLDMGCGDGAALRYLQTNFQTTGYGVDVSPQAIERAKTIELSQNNFYSVADARALPFQDQEFDIVLSWGLLTYFEDIQKAVAEAYRVLKPGGVLNIIQPNMLSFGTLQEWYLRLRKRWPYGMHRKDTVFALRRLLKKSGFTTVRYFTVPPYADMPLASSLDRFLRRLLPFWGHYLYIIAWK